MSSIGYSLTRSHIDAWNIRTHDAYSNRTLCSCYVHFRTRHNRIRRDNTFLHLILNFVRRSFAGEMFKCWPRTPTETPSRNDTANHEAHIHRSNFALQSSFCLFLSRDCAETNESNQNDTHSQVTENRREKNAMKSKVSSFSGLASNWKHTIRWVSHNFHF